MKTVNCLVIGLCILLFGASVGTSATKAPPDRRIALVIGNGKYVKSPLRNPPNDAADIAASLKKLDFDVRRLINVGQREMEDAIRDFGQRLRRGGIGIFYYAGHGVQVSGENYLIPVDAEIRRESDIKYEAVNVGRVLDEMYETGSGLNIVILDACRDNPFARSFRSSSRGLARMDAPKGTLIAYATAPGSVAADGQGRNGIYTKNLVRFIQVPGLSIEKVLKQVRVQVVRETGGKQIPWESSSLMGDFVFTKAPPAQTAKAAPAIPAAAAKTQEPATQYEILFWESIKDSNNVQMYNEYLKKFPNGMFAGLALIKIQNLQPSAPVPKAQRQPAEDPPPATVTAAVAPAPRAKPKPVMRSGSKIQVAVLPWDPEQHYWHWVVVDALKDHIDELDSVELAYTYYDMGVTHQGQRLDQKALQELGVNNSRQLWVTKTVGDSGIFGKSLSGSLGKLFQATTTGQPNIDLVVKVGQQLGVDAVVMSKVDIHVADPPNGEVEMFLIEIPSGKYQRAKSVTDAFDHNGYNITREVAGIIFREYDLSR
jgi:hypothetical protein